MTDEAGRLVHDCRENGVAVGERERSGEDERHPRESTCREKKTRRSRHVSIVASAPDAVEWCAPAVRRVPGARLRRISGCVTTRTAIRRNRPSAREFEGEYPIEYWLESSWAIEPYTLCSSADLCREEGLGPGFLRQRLQRELRRPTEIDGRERSRRSVASAGRSCRCSRPPCAPAPSRPRS